MPPTRMSDNVLKVGQAILQKHTELLPHLQIFLLFQLTSTRSLVQIDGHHAHWMIQYLGGQRNPYKTIHVM